MGDTLIKVEDLCKIYNPGENEVRALDHVNLEIKTGEFVAIIGQSGSGKSTFMNMLGCLDVPTSGKYYLNGTDVSTMKDNDLSVVRNREIGFIFQGFHLIPELTVEQNLVFPVLLDYKKPDMDYVEELLGSLGLKERRKHLPSQLSGGQQQRVAIGRALMNHPALILADEPTGNLDSKTSREVIALLHGMSRKYRQSVLMITHNMNIAADADRVFRVTDGCLEEVNSGREAFHE